MDSDPIPISELIQGVFELLPPYQGYAIYLDDYVVFISGDSDSTMYSNGGKYEIKGDTITDIFLFSTNPNMVGGSTKWIAEKLEDNTIKGTMFNADGSIMGDFRMIQKVNPTEELRSQMKDFEGMLKYLPPLQGLGTNLGGYYIYLFGQSENTMTANAGTYEVHDDTITNKYKFAINPQLIGGGFSWINQSVVRDTFTFAILNDAKEISSIGKSVRAK
jgi:hypothetical protein